MNLVQHYDSTSVKFRVSGKPSFKRSNLRKVRKTYNKGTGNEIGPRHYNKRTQKFIYTYVPRIRGSYKSQIDYSIATSKGKNGAVSLKV
jgi:hypothetical protein